MSRAAEESLRCANAFLLRREHDGPGVSVMLIGSLDRSRPPTWTVEAVPAPKLGAPVMPMMSDPTERKEFDSQAEALAFGWLLLDDLS